MCVEFSVEADRPPNVIQMPKDTPQELSAVIPIVSQIPKMIVQSKTYANRMILFFSPQEWERMRRKYQYGDEVEVKVEG